MALGAADSQNMVVPLKIGEIFKEILKSKVTLILRRLSETGPWGHPKFLTPNGNYSAREL